MSAKHTPEQAHCIGCMDTWAIVRGLATYTELLLALKDAADVIALLAINCCDRVDVSEDSRLQAVSDVIAKASGSAA